MIAFLLQLRWNHVRRMWRGHSAGQLITSAAFIGLFLLLAAGLCALLILGFAAVEENEFLRAALPFFIYELFLLVISGLVFVSAIVTGMLTLFRGRGDFWFMASPRYRTLLLERGLTVCVFSLWPLIVLAVPILIAMQVVYQVGWGGLLLGLLAVSALGLLATLSALGVLLMVADTTARLAARGGTTPRFGAFAATLGGLMALAGGLVWWALRDLDISRVFAVQDFSLTQAPVALIAETFQFFPSHFAAQALYAVQTGAYELAMVAFLILVAVAGIAACVVWLYADRFLWIWQSFQETGFAAKADIGRAAKPRSVTFPDQPLRALFYKEHVLFWRTPRNILWLGFLVALWLVVTSFDVFLAQNLDREIVGSVTSSQLIQALQLLVVVYFSAAIVLRFAFPSFSVERDTAWILLHAPLSRTRWFAAKAIFYVGSMSLVALAVALVHVVLLPVTLSSASAFLIASVVASATVTLLGLSLGARFPNFQTNDPQKLSTTVPGLAFITLAIAYGTGCAYVLYAVFQTGSYVPLLALILASLVLGWVLVRGTLRALPYITFTDSVQS